jgi:hypothetical protein
MLCFSSPAGRLVSDLEKQFLSQIKVAVKQTYESVDAIIFEAALTLNAIETKYKQREYIS